jgi:hypothetical protein
VRTDQPAAPPELAGAPPPSVGPAPNLPLTGKRLP